MKPYLGPPLENWIPQQKKKELIESQAELQTVESKEVTDNSKRTAEDICREKRTMEAKMTEKENKTRTDKERKEEREQRESSK